MPRSRGAFAILAFVMTLAQHAAAQSPGFAVNRFEPAERGSDWFVSESLDLRGRARPVAGVVGDWAYRPLVLPSGAAVIVDDVVLHAGGGIMLADRFRAAASLPIAVLRRGEDASGGGAPRAPSGEAAVGDLRLAFDAAVVGEYGDLFHAAIGAAVYVPTGSRAAYTSDGTVRVAPRLLLAGDGGAFAYAAKVGFAYRPFEGTFEGRPLGSEAFFSVSGGVKINDRVIFGPEVYGSTVVTRGEAFAKRATPIAGLFGMHVIVFDDFRLGDAIGTSFVHGDGAPDLRVLVSLEYVPDVCVDKDGDGICAKDDACPLVSGVRTGVRATNGCPVVRPAQDTPTPEPPKEVPAKEVPAKEVPAKQDAPRDEAPREAP